MNNDRGSCHPDPRRAGDGAGLSPRRNATDPEGLAIAREMQERLQPAKVILLGSRAVGDHRDDSDVDLMAVAPDEAAAAAAKETLRNLLDGKYDVPVVNVITITRDEFRRTAPLAQSWAGQAARHGVTPDGRSLGYQPERDPTAEEIRQAAIFWLTLAEARLDAFSLTSENGQLSWSHIPAFEGQTALERAFKGLLTAGNDGARFRRDASIMWRHTEKHPAHRGPEGRQGNGAPAGRHDGAGRAGVQPDKVHRSLPAGGHRPGPHGTGTTSHRPPLGAGSQRPDSRGAGPVWGNQGRHTAGKTSPQGDPLAAAAVQECPRGPGG